MKQRAWFRDEEEGFTNDSDGIVSKPKSGSAESPDSRTTAEEDTIGESVVWRQTASWHIENKPIICADSHKPDDEGDEGTDGDSQ